MEKQESKFKELEVFQSLRVIPPFFARLDGWSFHTYTRESNFNKPFDDKMREAMLSTVNQFFETFKPTLAHIHSDEISFLFMRPTVFDRVEKLDSLFAGFFSSRFTRYFSPEFDVALPATFDSRIIPITPENIIPYLTWRQTDSIRNFIHGWAFETALKNSNGKQTPAAKKLNRMNSKDLTLYCAENGLHLDRLPLWQKNGTLAYMEKYQKNGYNPKTKESVIVTRSRCQFVDAPRYDSEEGWKILNRLTTPPIPRP